MTDSTDVCTMLGYSTMIGHITLYCVLLFSDFVNPYIRFSLRQWSSMWVYNIFLFLIYKGNIFKETFLFANISFVSDTNVQTYNMAIEIHIRRLWKYYVKIVHLDIFTCSSLTVCCSIKCNPIINHAVQAEWQSPFTPD